VLAVVNSSRPSIRSAVFLKCSVYCANCFCFVVIIMVNRNEYICHKLTQNSNGMQNAVHWLHQAKNKLVALWVMFRGRICCSRIPFLCAQLREIGLSEFWCIVYPRELCDDTLVVIITRHRTRPSATCITHSRRQQCGQIASVTRVVSRIAFCDD